MSTVVMDESRREVRLDDALIDLSTSEFTLLAALMRRPGAAISSADLLLALRGPSWVADREVLQVQISRLRRKLGESAAHPRFIITIYGFGYRFEPMPSDGAELADVPEVDQPPSGTLLVSVLMSLDRQIRWVSDNVVDLLDWYPADLVGRRPLDLVHPDSLLSNEQWRSMGRGQPLAGLGRVRTKSGDWQDVTASGRPVIDLHGTVTGLLVTWEPYRGAVSSSELTPISLAVNSEHLQRTRATTLILDADLILQGIEPARASLGWEPEEILGTFFSPTGLGRLALQQVIDTGIATTRLVLSGPVSLRHRDGTTVAANIQARIEVGERDEFVALHATLTTDPPEGESIKDRYVS